MVEAKFIFITPSQYNRIYSASSGILINQKMNSDTVYLSEEIKIRDHRITYLESVIKDMGEALGFYNSVCTTMTLEPEKEILLRDGMNGNESGQSTFEDHLNIGTKQFLLDVSMKIAQASTLGGVDALNVATTVLQSGIIEARNHLAIKIQELNECEDVIRFYVHSWDSGEEATKYFSKKPSK